MNLFRTSSPPALLVVTLSLASCGSSEEPDPQKAAITTGLKQYLSEQITVWRQSAAELQAAAPTPQGRGWDATMDAAAIQSMRSAWITARNAYEQIEGAIAEIFPDSDVATDARYEDFLAKLGDKGDDYAFDDKGVVGMHGIERILYADSVPDKVVAFEKDQARARYQAPAFPKTEQEAADFKQKLAAKLVTDIEQLQRDFGPLKLDLAFAYNGILGLVREQVEKVNKASTGAEESRYAQATLRDLKANHRGCLDVYKIFQPWVLSKAGGADLDKKALAAFDRLRAAYDAVPGDALPALPEGWSSKDPTPALLATPFGMLVTAVEKESDAKADGSLAQTLTKAGMLIGLDAP